MFPLGNRFLPLLPVTIEPLPSLPLKDSTQGYLKRPLEWIDV